MSDERIESTGGDDSALTRTAEVVGNAFGTAVNTVSDTAATTIGATHAADASNDSKRRRQLLRASAISYVSDQRHAARVRPAHAG